MFVHIEIKMTRPIDLFKNKPMASSPRRNFSMGGRPIIKNIFLLKTQDELNARTFMKISHLHKNNNTLLQCLFLCISLLKRSFENSIKNIIYRAGK